MKIEEIISNDEMRHAIERSGYLIEQRVEQIISEDGYYVQTNPAFRDYYTGKSREYDIFAMSGRKIFKDDANFIFPVVLAECMNNTQPLVFFHNRSYPFNHVLPRDKTIWYPSKNNFEE